MIGTTYEKPLITANNSNNTKWKLSWNIPVYTLHAHFCTFGTDLYAQLVLINKISALELSKIGSLLRVHCWLGQQ